MRAKRWVIIDWELRAPVKNTNSLQHPHYDSNVASSSRDDQPGVMPPASGMRFGSEKTYSTALAP